MVKKKRKKVKRKAKKKVKRKAKKKVKRKARKKVKRKAKKKGGVYYPLSKKAAKMLAQAFLMIRKGMIMAEKASNEFKKTSRRIK